MSSEPPKPAPLELLQPALIEEPTWLFPFEGMSVGDSFFIPTLQPGTMIASIVDRAKSAEVRIRCFACKGPDGSLGVRVWRTG